MGKIDEIRERKNKLNGYSPSPMSGPSWQILAQQNVDIGTLLDDLAAKDAEIAALKARLKKAVELPCEVGAPYAGICREMQPKKRGGWKTVSWIETGVIKEFEIIAHITADKAGYDHSRSVEELGESWFIGDNAREQAKAALERGAE